MTTTSPPASQAMRMIIRGGASVALATSTAVTAAAVGRHMARRVQQRRAVGSLAVDHLFEHQLGDESSGGGDEGEHHRVPPPDPPSLRGACQTGQNHQRPDRVHDRRCDAVAPDPGGLLKRINSASAGSGQRVCHTRAATSATSNDAATLAAGVHGGLSASDRPSGVTLRRSAGGTNPP